MLKVEKSKEGYIFTEFDNKQSRSIEISNEDFFQLEDLIKFERYKLDVLNHINTHGLEVDSDTVDKITESFKELWEENMYDDYGMSMFDCLKQAFEENAVDYDEEDKDIDNEKYFLF